MGNVDQVNENGENQNWTMDYTDRLVGCICTIKTFSRDEKALREVATTVGNSAKTAWK